MILTVREFAKQSIRLVNPGNPTVPLQNDDQDLLITVLNQLLNYYAATGLMITIAKTLSTDINLGDTTVRFVGNNYPTDTVTLELVTLTNLSPSFTVVNGTIYAVGDEVTGNGIPANTTILSIDGNEITLTNDATLTGSSTLTFTQPIVVPGIVFIKEGRLANYDSAWLTLSGVTYPLIQKSRDEFLAAWKYEPLQGLPRFAITYPGTEWTDIQLYPAPSQFFTFNIRGKIQISDLTSNNDLSLLPTYFTRFLLFACARDWAMYKGRSDAWTEKLEMIYQESKDTMEAASEINISIAGDEQSLLNGAWRIRAGI